MSCHSNDQKEILLFERVWRQGKKECEKHPCGGDCSICRPEPQLVRRLLALAASEPERPLQELKPVIERMLQEGRYVTAGADSMLPYQHHPPIARQAELVVRTLAQMRSLGKGECRNCGTCKPQAEKADPDATAKPGLSSQTG